MHLRAISTACFLFCLGVVGACDDKADAKVDAKAKADEKKADAKVEEKKADAKVEDVKADDAKADDAKADDAKAEDVKAEDAKEDAKADAKADDAKAEDAKEVPKETPKDTPKTDPKKPEPKGDVKPSDSKVEIDSKSIYDKKCKTCHGATGNADTKVGKENDIPDWTVAGWKAKWTEPKVIDIVKNGKAGTKMKAFKDKLTEDEIVAVSKYSRTLGK